MLTRGVEVVDLFLFYFREIGGCCRIGFIWGGYLMGSYHIYLLALPRASSSSFAPARYVGPNMATTTTHLPSTCIYSYFPGRNPDIKRARSSQTRFINSRVVKDEPGTARSVGSLGWGDQVIVVFGQAFYFILFSYWCTVCGFPVAAIVFFSLLLLRPSCCRSGNSRHQLGVLSLSTNIGAPFCVITTRPSFRAGRFG